MVGRGRTLVALVSVVTALTLQASQASADPTAVGLTTDVPSRIVTLPLDAGPSAVNATVHDVAFPPGATDTDLIGIDHRPKSEDLYALGAGGTLYVLQGDGPFTAVQVNSTPATSPLNGTAFGFAFNPVKDAISVIDDDENLLFNPLNGSLLGPSDGTVAYAPGDPNAGVQPRPSASAFSSLVPGQPTTMYAIDAATGSLAIQGPANSVDAGVGGLLHTVGPLVFPATDVAGLDIGPGPTTGADLFAVLQSSSTLETRLCRVSRSASPPPYFLFSAGQAVCGTPINGVGPLESFATVPPSIIEFTDRVYVVREGMGTTVDVVRHGALHRGVQVSYHAVLGTHPDFAGFSGSFYFEPGESLKRISLPIDDAEPQEPREIHLLLSAGPNGMVVAGQGSLAYVTIMDNDGGPNVRRKLKVRFHRPHLTLRQVLRRGRLPIEFTCNRECFADGLQLGAGGHWIYSNKAQWALSDGTRTAVFELTRNFRRRVRAATRRGESLKVTGDFGDITDYSSRAMPSVEASLAFRLSR